ncbi:MAG: hypothetical protein AB7P18_28025 [Candidatus Binatia bacterium]
MVGLIWFVQIVHYPLFAQVGMNLFPAYETAHNRLTTWVVGPPMLVEGVTAIGLLLYKPDGISSGLVWCGLMLLLAIWASTAFLQVPQHDILTRGFDGEAHRFLVTSNWLRTIAWTLRGVLVLVMVGAAMNNVRIP